MAGRPKGLPKYGGRAKGTPNKVTADIKAICQGYGQEIIDGLIELFRTTDNGQVKTAVAKELLDRGYGKATQFIDASVDASLTVNVLRFTDASN